MIGNPKVYITRPMDDFGINLTHYVEGEAGRISVGQWNELGVLEYTEHDRGMIIPKESVLKMTMAEAEALYNSLGELFDGPAATATTEKLEATEKHLATVLDILNRTLPSAVREVIQEPIVEVNH